MLILGHRGATGKKFAENCLPAFVSAIEQGADGIEMDLRVSRDGEIVVVHDPSLQRIAGDAHKTSELTAQELTSIPLRHAGCIMTLNDVTASIHEPAILNFDIKHPVATEALITKLKTSSSLRSRSIVSSFYRPSLKQVRKECPDVKVIVLMMRWPSALHAKWTWKKLKEIDAWGVAFALRYLTPRRVKILRSMGYAVVGWDSRGSKKEALRAMTLGLDVVIVKDVETAVSKKK